MQILVCMGKSFSFFGEEEKEKGRKRGRKECGKKRLCNEFRGGQAGWIPVSNLLSFHPFFHFIVWVRAIVLSTCVLPNLCGFTWTALCALEFFFSPFLCGKILLLLLLFIASSKRVFLSTFFRPVWGALHCDPVMSAAYLCRDANHTGLKELFRNLFSN